MMKGVLMRTGNWGVPTKIWIELFSYVTKRGMRAYQAISWSFCLITVLSVDCFLILQF